MVRMKNKIKKEGQNARESGIVLCGSDFGYRDVVIPDFDVDLRIGGSDEKKVKMVAGCYACGKWA